MLAADHTNKLLGTSVPVSFIALENRSHGWFDLYVAKNGFDFCINSLPDHLHFSFTKKTLCLKIPTLVVKPLTPTYSEAKDLLDISLKNRTYCAVEFHKRWDESNLYLKQVLDENRIGNVLYISVDYSQQISIPTEQFKKWSDKTNIFQYLGVHYVDLIYFLTKKKPKRLNVYGTKRKLRSLGIDTWDSVHVSSVWGDAGKVENDFYVHFNLNWIDSNNSSAMSDQKMITVGTEGRIELDQKNRGVNEVTNEGVKSINPYFATWLPGVDGNCRLNGYGFDSIYTFISDVNRLICKEVTMEQLNAIRPGIQSSLVSTQFIDQVTQNLNNGNLNQTELC